HVLQHQELSIPPSRMQYIELSGPPYRNVLSLTRSSCEFLENMIYLLAGRPIKNQSACSECVGNGKATAMEEVPV
ncbi:DNA-directed RNA polymerase subunit beta, partial [Dissostichus eleginoides]